jgi:hypothetical protein
VTELPREAQLVLACARTQPDHDALARIAALAAAPLDWDASVRLGIRHGLGALMHRNVNAAQVVMPRAAEAALWARAEWAAHRGHAMSAELERVAAALIEARVRFVSFKGPLLAERLHGDTGLRESGDLDLLVRRRAVPATRAVLESLGYAAQTPVDAERERLCIGSPHRHEIAFSNAGSPCMVELQWRANPELDIPALEEDAWWDRAPSFEWRGLEMTGVPADEELLALLVHGTKHFWGSLDWLVDIAQIARRADAPWPGLVRLARSHRAVARAALGIDLAHRLLRAPCPDLAMQLVAEARIASVVDEVVPRLLEPAYRAHTLREALRLQLALDDGAGQRARRLAGTLRPTPGDWEWVRLPRALSWAYWLLRPVRLACKYLTRFPRTPAGATPRTPPPRPHSTN